ncbi:MAG: rhodanese-like domain-containing protein [Pontiellaceae bacterium]|nr:rhodanese-like domain-containing protein [Pontiellaceae bacterium]
MNKYIVFGIAGLAVGFTVYQHLFGGGADRSIDIPALVRDGALIIDVRTAGEFASGHIEGAINIPYDVIGKEIEHYAPERDRSILVYCRSGNRSSHAKQTLHNMGYTQVSNGGGYAFMRRKLK